MREAQGGRPQHRIPADERRVLQQTERAVGGGVRVCNSGRRCKEAGLVCVCVTSGRLPAAPANMCWHGTNPVKS